MTVVKNIMNIVPAVQAASLAGSLAHDAKKKKKTTKDILSSGTKAIVGTSLIQTEAQLIGLL